VPVTPGECLNVYVGEFGWGHGGWGLGSGGNHGVQVGDGNDGAGGGGASALTRGEPGQETVLLVAGGGGGGGGDSTSPFYGGPGGDGAGGDGPGTPRGEDGATGKGTLVWEDDPLGGAGGWGGDGFDGGDGASFTPDLFAGAGGGGGSGWQGGDGGAVFVPPLQRWLTKPVGGGGGGGGSSYAAHGLTEVRFNVAEEPCPVGGGAASCDGELTLTWIETPAKISAYSGSGQSTAITSRLPRPLQAKVTARDGNPVPNAAVTFTLPQDGATARFDAGDALGEATVTVLTDAGGLATSPPLRASGTAGSWTARATVEGVSTPARYALANDPAATATALYSSASRSVAGEPVRFTAIVAAAPSSAAPPRGTVRFEVDGDQLGDPVPVDSDGIAHSEPIAPEVGSRTIDAIFESDDGDFGRSTRTITQQVARAGSAVTLSSEPNPSTDGQDVTFTIDVAPVAPGAGTPSGEVQLTLGGADSGAAVSLSGGSAQVTRALGEGTPLVGVRYAGDDRFEASSGTLVQAVGDAATAVVLSSSNHPAVFGEPLELTATLSSSAGTPTGAVDFSVEGEGVICAVVTVQAGSASCTPAEPLPPGEHVVSADYSPDVGGFDASSGSMVQHVTPARSSIAVEATPDPSVFGVDYSLHADVTPVAPGAGTPGGSVQFLIDGLPVAGPVDVGVAGATLDTLLLVLPGGPHVVEAEYSGDPDFAGGRAATTFVVDRAQTATVLSSSAPGGAAFGDPVSFDAAVSLVGPGLDGPGGGVQFRVDGVDRGDPVPVRGGRATSAPIVGLAPGEHDVRASYLGDRDYEPSEATLVQVVAPPPAPGAGTSGAGGGSAPAGASGAPLLCSRAVVLTDVRRAGRGVHVAGVTRPAYAGRRAAIHLRGRLVAWTTVRSDGTFGARVARRPARGSGPRYLAWVAGRRSVAVGLSSPLEIDGMRSLRGGRVRVGLRWRGGGRRTLVLGRQQGCSARAAARMQSVRTDRRGRARVTLPRPESPDTIAVYRLWAPSGKVVSRPIVVRAGTR
jgi:hypothetical protein